MGYGDGRIRGGYGQYHGQLVPYCDVIFHGYVIPVRFRLVFDPCDVRQAVIQLSVNPPVTMIECATSAIITQPVAKSAHSMFLYPP